MYVPLMVPRAVGAGVGAPTAYVGIAEGAEDKAPEQLYITYCPPPPSKQNFAGCVYDDPVPEHVADADQYDSGIDEYEHVPYLRELVVPSMTQTFGG